MTIQELRDQRAKVWEQAKALNEKTHVEGAVRAFTAEEDDQWVAMNAELDSLARRIEVEEQAAARAKEFSGVINPGVGRGIAKQPAVVDPELAAVAFDKFLRFGVSSLDDAERAILNPSRDKRARASEIELRLKAPNQSPAFRGQTVGTGSAGGFFVPEGFVPAVERSMLAFGGMRQASRILATAEGNDLPWPTANDTGNVGELLAEETTIGSHVGVTVGQIIFKAYKYSSKLVQVSRELLEDAAVDVAGMLGSMLGERIARITNTHFTTGDNTGKPQGVVPASSSTVTSASATAITADELLDLQHSVDPAYREGPQVRWMFKDSTLAAIRKLKTTDLQYIWQPGANLGEPSLLFGKPYIINQDMDAIASTKKPVLFGDFSKYIIRDVASFRLRRLEELYAGTDQVGFVAFSRHDGRVLDAGTDPIRHLLCAT
ncbi:MAG TPA: phage major capsid protein [Anaerolineales bacterium]|nr:phage major capsid protein [Anaerolineales bacterium]